MPLASHNSAALEQYVVVDPHMGDYPELIGAAMRGRARLTFTSAGADALRLAPSFPDAWWLISTHLPDMTGLELLEMLLSIRPHLATVLVDAHDSSDNARRARQLGAADYLVKPLREVLPRPRPSARASPGIRDTG